MLFKSGSIVLHIAERSDALMPTEPNARSREDVAVHRAQHHRAAHHVPCRNGSLQRGGGVDDRPL